MAKIDTPFTFFDAQLPALLRYRLRGRGKAVVLLDAGIRNSDVVWSAVAPRLESTVQVLEIDRFAENQTMHRTIPERFDADLHATAMHRLLLRELQDPVMILVGWSVGTIYVQALATHLGEQVRGMVLVDPAPLDIPAALLDAVLARSTESAPKRGPAIDIATLCNISDGFLPRISAASIRTDISTTVILPNLVPDRDNRIETLLDHHQSQDMRRFSALREVIAGRSGSSVPTERPDVVIEAILQQLGGS